MRFHRLSLEGVGSFAHQEIIDFDRLGSSGLFLIHGDTGSGKSTILDAIYCALYGDVPGGSDNNRRRMVSWYWDGKKHPKIVLEFSARGIFYRLTRTIWTYNQKGAAVGHGAELEVSHDASFSTITETVSGVNEVNERVVRIVGLEATHFEQTVMLPQGKAQEFLTSNGSQRYEVLKNLFKSDIYSDLEKAALELQKQGKIQSEQYNAAQLERLQTLLNDLQHNPLLLECEVDLPGLWDALSPTEGGKGSKTRIFATLYSQVLPELDTVQDFLTTRHESTRQQLLEAQQSADQTADKLSSAKATSQRIRDAHDLQARLKSLEARRDEIVGLRMANEKASRAATVIQAHLELRSPEISATRKVEEMTELVERVLHQDPVLVSLQPAGTAMLAVSPDQWLVDDTKTAALRSLAKRARGLVQDQRRRLQTVAENLAALHRQEEKNQDFTTELRSLATRQEKLQTQLDKLTEEYESAQAALTQNQKLAAQTPHLAEQKKESDKAVAQARDLERIQQQVKELASKIAAEKTAVADQAHVVKQVLETWIAAEAPRLAQGLVPGEPCPVCGACEHPHPAVSSGEVAEYADFASANAQLEQLQEKSQATEKQFSEINGEIRHLKKSLAGKGLEELENTNRELGTQLAAATAAANILPQLQQKISDLEQKIADNKAAATELEKSVAVAQSQLKNGIAALASLEAAIATDLKAIPADTNPGDFATQLLDTNEQCFTLLDSLDSAYQEWLTRQERWLVARDRLHAALRNSGYDTVEQARRDFKEPQILESDLAAVAKWDSDLTGTNNKLEVLRDLLDQEIPDLPTLEQAHLEAKQKLSDLQSLEKELALTCRKMSDTRENIDASAQAWAKSSSEIDTVNELVAALSGKKTGGPSLSSAYLSTRLKQVIEIANLTVKDISNGYLEMSFAQRGLDDRSGTEGLGINIYNASENTLTSPQSLSGGEKFYCSLAIALALSSVVQAERGGVELDNIFIDEGFGTLDDTTRDIVVGTLKRLYRDSKRSVGIISHVNELKDDIPVQVAVKNYRSGFDTANGKEPKRGTYLSFIGLD